jgi:hypothetical protein
VRIWTSGPRRDAVRIFSEPNHEMHGLP